MPAVKGSLPVFGFTFLFWLAAGLGYAQAQPISHPDLLADEDLESIHAQGISVGGDFSSSCSTGSNTVCLGTSEWNDNHQFDASNHKGAIDMNGNVQQYVSAEINLNQTESAGATGVNVLGNVSLSNSTVDISNTNNATSYIGGF
jgi:hypothetical protein